jgi:biopolymer transport protein ExbD
MRKVRLRSKLEPTIALINVVFLMLIFFLVAGSIGSPIKEGLNLVRTEDLEGREPADALVLGRTGAIGHRGAPVTDLGAYLDAIGPQGVARIVPDRDAPAARLIALGRELRLAGAERVLIVTEQGLE